MNTPELTLEELDKFEKNFLEVRKSKWSMCPEEDVWPQREEFTMKAIKMLPALLSLARLQIEQRGLPGGPASTRSACAPHAGADVVPAVRKEIESCHDALRDLYTTNSYSLPEVISFKLRHFQKWAFKFLTADRPPIHTEESPSDGEIIAWLPHHMRVVKADATRTIHQIELPVAKSFRSAIKAAMEQEKTADQ